MINTLHFLKSTLFVAIFSLSNIVIPIVAMGATWTDHGAYSITWYDKNQTSFDISTPQELAGIAYLVNNNFTDFSGKTINIRADIDLSTRNWVPIGLGSYVFKGSVEGNNYTISNINIVTGTSSAPFATGFWINISNSEIKNLNFKGSVNADFNNLGLVAFRAEMCTFENINVVSGITFNHPNVHHSTNYEYPSNIAGMICRADGCKFINVTVDDKLDYTFGASHGNNCYGKVTLNCGGIVAGGSYTDFIKCHAINHCTILINGYVTTTVYTGKGDSFITYGGIVGSLGGNTSKVIGCLAENNYFEGNHNCGTFDTKYFRFGGVVGYMSSSDKSTLKNCVATNASYYIYGHDYTWQATWYHTESHFGGVAFEVPKNYAGCYSNNDVIRSVYKVGDNATKENGSTAFSSLQMNTQSFVDELNLYSQLEFDEDYWTLESGKLKIKQKSMTEDSGIEIINEAEAPAIVGIYSLNGYYVGSSIEDLVPGIYVVKTHKSNKKIIIR